MRRSSFPDSVVPLVVSGMIVVDPLTGVSVVGFAIASFISPWPFFRLNRRRFNFGLRGDSSLFCSLLWMLDSVVSICRSTDMEMSIVDLTSPGDKVF